MKKYLLIVVFLFTAVFPLPQNFLTQKDSPPPKTFHFLKHIKDYVPILSASNFILFADFIYHGEGTLDAKKVKDGDIIWIPTRCFVEFMKQVFPDIEAKIIIFSSFRYIPKRKEKVLEGFDPSYDWYGKMLDDERVIAWFGNNLTSDHPKVYPVPLGFRWFRTSQRFSSIWNSELLQSVEKLLNSVTIDQFFKGKKIKCYVNFAMTSPNRQSLIEILKNKNKSESFPFARSPKNLLYTIVRPRPFEEYMRDLQNSEFVISPSGVNPDCYRIWEALYAGCIPIVEKTGIERLFDDLPVLIVENFECITREFLEEAKQKMQKKEYNLEKLHSQYWLDLMLEKQRSVRE